MKIVKISMFYITNDGKVINEKDVVKGVGKTVHALAMVTMGGEVVPVVVDTIGATGIVAHASTNIATTVATATTPDIGTAVAPIIATLQDLAEPFSYGFAIKGVLQKMSGKDNEGAKTLKNALGGYVVVQFLPEIYKLLRLVKF